MPEISRQFEPALGRHAIERCGASLMFAQSLPTKLFLRAEEAEPQLLEKFGLRRLQIPQIQLGPPGSAPSGPMPLAYAAPSGSLTLSPNTLEWATGAYSRWKSFTDSFVTILSMFEDLYFSSLDVSAVKLDYTDRFFWNGAWDDVDYQTIFRADCGYIAPTVFGKPKQWHSHCGWFSTDVNFRRLVNVNIDVTSVRRTKTGPAQPSVSILTLVEDKFDPRKNALLKSIPEVVDKLTDQHDALLDLFCDIVRPEICDRVGLKGRSR